jgi:hypothetical protein
MWTLSWLKKTKPGPVCPIVQVPCLGAGCAWWQKFKGKDPQSEKIVDRWGCAIVWNNTLLVENSQMVNQAVASIQSARNENVKAIGELRDALPAGRKRRN